ncbi:unnamed protein product [Penicillium olsonii]|uniref:Uncharacterized protein n=1 Tax=Penicillium olsonii TaxID=99116 RepID=A0A9W4HD82_PENOL|nr:unnamed protein product [Penicillium olsonii]CAG8016367.1 unnamed protein product [Penicillium olsonii]
MPCSFCSSPLNSPQSLTTLKHSETPCPISVPPSVTCTMGKKSKAQKAKARELSSIPTTSPEHPPTDLPTPPYDKPVYDETDFPPLPHSPVNDTLPGNRRGSGDTEDVSPGNEVEKAAGGLAKAANGDLDKGSAGGLKVPGKTEGKDDNGSLQIKIHLNLHAKVKLELDAQVYGDIVIGLL